MKRVLQAGLAVALAASPAAASERHFTYTYESAVLSPGLREIEPWSTFRLGKSEPYSAFDSRIEAELGLTDRLQTSLDLNAGAVTEDTPAGRSSSTELEGISSEWKLKLSDPVADRAGSALYAELSAGPSQVELEGKLILGGRRLYVRRCSGCHTLILPQAHAPDEWPVLVDAMAEKARLKPAEREDVVRFLVAVSSDEPKPPRR